MANYTSLEALFATVANATKIINNEEIDDSWTTGFSASGDTEFNGTAITNVYLNGNSKIAFNSTDEGGTPVAMLTVNSGDRELWNAWLEEGTVCGKSFVRIRWSGYAHYSDQGQYSAMTYDVAFCNDRVYLNVVDWPTDSSYLDGYTYLTVWYDGSSYDYGYLYASSGNPSATDNHYTWYYDDSQSTWDVKQGLDNFQIAKYLIKNLNDNKIYSESNGTWTEVTDSVNLASTFETYGMTSLPAALPSRFELLKWSDSEIVTDVVVEGDLNVSGDGNCIFLHPQITFIDTLLSVITHTDGAVYYSNEGTNWFSSTDSIADLSDFYIKVDLTNGSYFEDIQILYN